MIDSIIRGIVLGLVQGATEFLPVSSTGHLILVPRLFGWSDPGIAFDALIHIGTLVALVWMTWPFIHSLLRDAIFRGSRPARILCAQIAVACIPALAIAAVFGDAIESTFRSAGVIAFSLAFWGIVLWIADRFASRSATKTARIEDIGWTRSAAIGAAQAIALVPGVSRSGITMTAGLASRMDRSTAVQFSFLLSIPTIAAAGAKGILDTASHGLGGVSVSMLVSGFAAACLSGMLVIRFLNTYVAKHRFTPFVVYRLALALAVIILV
jgi:undecaprenyl-diphosphatase